MKLKNRLKQVFCKHDYRLFGNIYGDLINSLNARTVYICPKCHKRKFAKDYIEAPINYNSFLRDAVTSKQINKPFVSPNTIKDIEQYKREFSGYLVVDLKEGKE